MTMVRSIVVEKLLPHPPDIIWHALTNSGLISQWLMPNDFVPVVGHRFTFTTRPIGEWDGVVHCEVLVCEPPSLLRYSWSGGTKSSDQYAASLDSIVTWTLTPAKDGTHLRLEHAGFRSPENDFAFNTMRGGWNGIMSRIADIVGALV
jgi:uncharacterized protein YndB with AHSA1/START domain